MMRVFVAGASGAIGTRLVPQLIARGHEVIGTSRSTGHAERVRALGADPIVLDLLDARAVRKAVLETKPEALVHQATALANLRDFKHFDRSFAQTNRLRTEDEPLDPTPVAAMRETSAAMHHLDQAVTEAGGIALRYGGFYGAPNDGTLEPVHK